jgi:hypothetical protein
VPNTIGYTLHARRALKRRHTKALT